MGDQREQVFGVIDALPDPHASVIEDYVLSLEQDNAKLREENDRSRRDSEAASKYMDTQGDKIIALQQENARLLREYKRLWWAASNDDVDILEHPAPEEVKG